MISRFSVKKPYTVVVAIVLVIILGVVSFGKMNTDLLPSMNLPYAIVMTTYQGASPETVEMVVTKPVEQSMATVTDIENVSSQSRENVSLVILEFQETADMDSATIEMREKLDQISGYWDDSVGKPLIMKLNPDMMPIMIAAVEVDGLEDTQVTDYVESHIEAEMESVAGVASVSTTGNITESIDVLIRSDKIKAANKKVMAALDDKFREKEEELEDAQKELDDGKKELEEGKQKLEDGQSQLDAGKDAMVGGLAQGEQSLIDAENKIQAGLSQIDSQLAQLDKQQETIDSGRTQVEQGLSEIAASRGQLQTALDALVNQRSETEAGLAGIANAEAELVNNENAILDENGELNQAITALQQQIDQLQAQLNAGGTGGGDDYYGDNYYGEDYGDGYGAGSEAFDPAAIQEMITQLTNQKAELEAQKQGHLDEIAQARAQLQSNREQIEAALAQIDEQTAAMTAQIQALDEQTAQLEAKKASLDEAQSKLDAGRKELETYRSKVAAGQAQVDAGKVQMTTQQVMASIEMSVAQAKLDASSMQITQNEASLEQAQTQIDEGKDQLKDAKSQTKEQTSLSNLVTKDLIKGILAGENFSMPAGYIQEGNDEYLVRVGDKLEGTEDLENLVILDLGLDGLDPIRLKDVADITRQDDSDEVYARLNGNPGVMLTIEKQTGYSTGDVTDRLLERIEEIEASQPGVHFSVLMDQGVYIDLVVDSVMQNMIYGAILAVLVLLLFLKDIKPTIVIAFSIPISVVAAIVLMYFSGVTLNVISLSGLALGIGMLVDNSIVVIENIDRLRQKGVPAKKAAVEGARQVAGAIAASTLTTVCVFAPIVFTEGITRQLFVDMGLTIAYSLLASLAVALTLVPMMSAGLLKKTKPKKFRLLDAITNGYAKILSGALRVKFLVLLLALGLLVGSAVTAFKKGTAFMPPMESTQATMTISTGPGTPFGELTGYADEVIASIEDIDDIESIGAMSGGSSISSMTGGGSDSHSVSVYLLLKEDKKLNGEQLEKEILRRTEKIPCEVAVSTQSMDMSALGGSGVQIQIKGKDLDELSAIAKDIARIVGETEGTQNVSDGQEEADKEYRVIIQKSKAMEHKLTVAQLYQEIQGRLAEASSTTVLSTPDKDYNVYVRDENDEQLTREDIRNMKIKVTDQEGEETEIRLSDVAEFEEATSPQTITRDAQSRYMTVSAEIASGYNIGLVSSEIEKKLKDYKLPAGYTLDMVGEDETINNAMEQLTLMLLLALVFMYLIMVAQFQSLLSPFIIMFTVPLAFTGGFLGLIVTGKEVSVIAMIGFVMLSGIIVNNGIVLVDYTNQLRADGMDKREALIQAGRDRLRPIVMTALTTILGLSTMAMGLGMGGDMVQPMAIVTIGGLIYGTLLTLFVVPCIYDLLNRKNYRKDELEEAEDGI
ncbi:MAG: efflux RND transporter permease subunit [Blautia sp.]|nr:efflux RND transporter permease subunit [Blautia sp.]